MRRVIGILGGVVAILVLMLGGVQLFGQDIEADAVQNDISQPQPVDANIKRSKTIRVQSHSPAQAQSNSSSSRPTARSIDTVQANTPDGKRGYRAITETFYEEVLRKIPFQHVDAKTGKVTTGFREQVLQSPRTTTRYVPSGLPPSASSQHNPKVIKLADELRSMKEGDEGREAKTKEMKELLVQEFSKRHKQQSEEIERTEKRLDSLRALHEERGKNQDQIVQRRIEQLIGEPDELRWIPNSRSTQVTPPRLYGLVQSPAYNGYAPSALQPIPPRPVAPPIRMPSAALPPTQSQRAEQTHAPLLRDLFSAARRLSAAKEEAIGVSKQTEMPLNEGGFSPKQRRSAQLRLAKAKRDLAFCQAEWRAINLSLYQDLAYTEAVRKLVEEQMVMARKLHQDGRGTMQTVLEAQRRQQATEKLYEDAKAATKQLDQMQQLIDGQGDIAEEAESGSAE